MTKIKICGITNIEDADYAARMEADFIGFIFYPPSARYVDPKQAKEIVRFIRNQIYDYSPHFVGVFVDENMQKVKKIRTQVGLDMIQLHGNETPSMIQDLQPGAFKAMQPMSLVDVQSKIQDYVNSMSENNEIPHILIDAYHPTEKGGTGQLSNLKIAKWFAQRYRLLLAGGLNPENVTSIIQIVRPWGVDVSSGVEILSQGQYIKGCKDHKKIEAFIRAVRRADLE